MKPYLVKLLSFLLLMSNKGAAEVKCSAELQSHFNKIVRLPEGQTLLNKILEEGPLSIQINNHLSREFRAYWDSASRTIYLNKFPEITEGELIGSLLFEMHNAVATAKLNTVCSQVSAKNMEPQAYVEAIERIEYDNAVQTGVLIKKGVEQKIFPQDTFWEVLPSFESHFASQQEAGHTEWILKNYFLITNQNR